MADIFLSIIIPAKNEGHRIISIIKEIEKYFSGRKQTYEIIVVSDSSLCNTIEVVRNYKNIKIIDQKNRGKGYAVKCGMLEANGKYKLFMDADQSVKISNLDKFIPEAEKGNIAIASIGIRGSKINENNGNHRRTLGILSKTIINILFNLNIKDTQRGFKLFPNKVADLVFNRQTIDGFGFDVEILLIAKIHNIQVIEIPVLWDNPMGSQVRIHHYFKVLMELTRVKINQLLGKYKN